LVVWVGLLCKYKRVLSCLGCSSRPGTKSMFLVSYCMMSDDPAPLPLGDDLEVTLPAEMMLKVEDPKPLFVKIMNRISQSPTLGKFMQICILLNYYFEINI
jgi:hypothetical protein